MKKVQKIEKRHIVFNSELEQYAVRYINKTARIPSGAEFAMEIQKQRTLAGIMEQLLLFDKVAIKVDRQNLPLYFLLNELGVELVERLLESNIIQLVLWTPAIYALTGTSMPDGSIDESTVMGRPPIAYGAFTKEDSDPEKNIDTLLAFFPRIHKDRKQIFKKIALKQYVLPDNKVAASAHDIVIGAYQENKLALFGLPNEKAPDQLTVPERIKLLDLSNSVLETSVLAGKGFKSYGNYPYHNLAHDSIKRIESALKVSNGTSEILRIEHVPALSSLIIEEKIPIDRLFELRYKDSVKHYRKWINSVSTNADAMEITREYLDEVKGKNKFWAGAGGKFIRTIGMLGVGTGISAAMGPAAGAVAAKGADLGLGLLDTYVLDGLLMGWNPGMFVD